LNFISQGRTADIYTFGEEYILKLFHKEWAKESIEQEFKVNQLLRENTIQVPEAYEIINYEGRMGIIYERIFGPTVLQLMEKHPFSYLKQARLLADLHLYIHNFTCDKLPSQKKILTERIRANTVISNGQKIALLQDLANLEDSDSICHGDFNPDNVIISPKGPIIIDWTDATYGNPVADVTAITLMTEIVEISESASPITKLMFRLLRKHFIRTYKVRYFKNSIHQMKEAQQWIPIIAASYYGKQTSEKENERLLAIVDSYYPKQ
jgi:uncharacterized protein (TIGR02172 family)